MRVPGLVMRRPDAGEDPNGTPASRESVWNPGLLGRWVSTTTLSWVAVDDGDESGKLVSLHYRLLVGRWSLWGGGSEVLSAGVRFRSRGERPG